MNYNIEESHSLVCLKTFGSCLNICSYSLYMCTRFRRIRIPSIVIQTWFVRNFVPAVITLKKKPRHTIYINIHRSESPNTSVMEGKSLVSLVSSLFWILLPMLGPRSGSFWPRYSGGWSCGSSERWSPTRDLQAPDVTVHRACSLRSRVAATRHHSSPPPKSASSTTGALRSVPVGGRRLHDFRPNGDPTGKRLGPRPGKRLKSFPHSPTYAHLKRKTKNIQLTGQKERKDGQTAVRALSHHYIYI